MFVPSYLAGPTGQRTEECLVWNADDAGLSTHLSLYAMLRGLKISTGNSDVRKVEFDEVMSGSPFVNGGKTTVGETVPRFYGGLGLHRGEGWMRPRARTLHSLRCAWVVPTRSSHRS